jgi:hypothetical protein
MFLTLCQANRRLRSWEDFFTGEATTNVSEIMRENEKTFKDTDSVYIYNSLFYDYTDRCIFIYPAYPEESNLRLLCENVLFYNISYSEMGGVICVMARGDICLSKICVNSCGVLSIDLNGAFLFGQLFKNTTNELISLVSSPGFDLYGMSSICVKFDTGTYKNINASSSTAPALFLYPKVHASYSYFTGISNYLTAGQNVEIIFSQIFELSYCNFIDNFVANPDYTTAIIRVTYYSSNPKQSYVVGCSFIQNDATYVIQADNGASVIICESYIDSGSFNTGVLYTDLVDVAQTIRMRHFANGTICLTENIPDDPTITVTPKPTDDLYSDNINGKEFSGKSSSYTIAAAVAVGVSSVALVAVIIWASKKVIKKVIKKGLSSLVNNDGLSVNNSNDDDDVDGEYDEYEYEYYDDNEEDDDNNDEDGNGDHDGKG